MAKKIEIQLPVPAYVYKFLSMKYGNPMLVKNHQAFNLLFEDSYNKNFYTFTENINIIRIIVHRKFPMSIFDMATLEQYCKRVFLDNMYEFVNSAIILGVEQKDALRKFFEFYDITEEEYSLDTGYRMLFSKDGYASKCTARRIAKERQPTANILFGKQK